MTAILEARNLQKSYHDGSVVTAVLHGITLAVEPGEFMAIMGPSGCGKSTLLYVLGLLTHHDAGTVLFDGRDISSLDGAGRTRWRRERMGFVFQRFNLLPALSAEENVAMPLRLQGAAKGDGAVEMLDRVGLADKRHKRPGQLSIGEQQRVAIARSLIGRPAILFADEPTGNLDSENGDRILSILGDFHRGQGQTIIMVTHNEEAALRADRIVRMRDGRCVDG
jgi:putative ABC transport system ATP-binding protein